ncbi:bifunctional tetrahydrofolate synthase/dihydrofolate synthase [Candidatus Tachikawaea gelatinosa]|uniref:Dihydrofolate synthase/folylpolyglutamate synthase n=1 Tax=Candidatus Tachikawaea gelatinosa TaxID=1410383 RepID=A0A090BWE2_9ENTR|nr:bifunctional tetrahydrofolate synthase/dihydrofolate synthase [Candidatus Tachikawaea gelatinosa]BAP58451.1 FolC bifunctional protein [Candidatus Tachikawaea gelatinosa]
MKNHFSLINNESSFEEWLKYLENIYPDKIHLGLDRIRIVAKKLHLLNTESFVFTVGGTNGKGTTCRALELILINSGFKVGVYTSPHLLRYTERIRIGGKELKKKKHLLSFRMIEKYRGNIFLTFFEFITLSALFLFKLEKVDIIILEVGLGGRLDATNIIDSDVAIITSISLEHTNILGNSINHISYEKSGICRKDKPIILGETNALCGIIKYIKKIEAHLLQYKKHFFIKKKNKRWSFFDQQGNIKNLPLPKIPLKNAVLAIEALRISKLDIKESIIYNTLPEISLTGRFQIIANSPDIILDVAHNPHAAKYLAHKLLKISLKKKIHAVFGVLNDKDIVGIVKEMNAYIDYWYCSSLSCLRGTKSTEIAQKIVQPKNVPKCFSNVKDAFYCAINNANKKDIIIVFGSFYTVAEIIKIIKI